MEYRIESAAGVVLAKGFDTRQEAQAQLDKQLRRNNWAYLYATIERDW